MRRPTIRGTAKWGLTGVAVGIAVLWAFSYWRWVDWDFAEARTVILGHGTFNAFQNNGIPIHEKTILPLLVYSCPARAGGVLVGGEFPPWLHWWRERSGSLTVVVPLWIPFSLAALPAALLWRADWRRRALLNRGTCTGCGYDRTGLRPAAPCPECGRAPGGASAAP